MHLDVIQGLISQTQYKGLYIKQHVLYMHNFFLMFATVSNYHHFGIKKFISYSIINIFGNKTLTSIFGSVLNQLWRFATVQILNIQGVAYNVRAPFSSEPSVHPSKNFRLNF